MKVCDIQTRKRRGRELPKEEESTQQNSGKKMTQKPFKMCLSRPPLPPPFFKGLWKEAEEEEDYQERIRQIHTNPQSKA